MNAIESLILKTGCDENDLLNALKDRGWISDLCVMAKDIADDDANQSADQIRVMGMNEFLQTNS